MGRRCSSRIHFDMQPDHNTRCRSRFALRRALAAAVATFAYSAAVLAQPAEDKPISVESLVKAGWQIAGYTSATDNRAAFILFRHPNESYLVQCLAGYDVTRKPRVYSHCYALR